MQAAASIDGRSDAGRSTSARGQGVKRKGSQKDIACAKAVDEKETMEALFCFEKHWESRQRKRDFDAKLASCERVASRCGGYVMDQDCMLVSQQLFDVVEKLRERAVLFDVIRTRFSDLVNFELTGSQVRLFKEANEKTMVNIMVSSLQMLARCQSMDVSIREGSGSCST